MNTDNGEITPKVRRTYTLREPTAPGMLTRRQVAAKLGKTVRTIDIWMEQGIIPFSRVGRSIYVNEADILALVPAGGGKKDAPPVPVEPPPEVVS